VQRNVCGSARDTLGVKLQQPERNTATTSTWRRDVDEDMAAFTAAVDTPGFAQPRTTAQDGG
jgi:hypothetical protein